MFMSAYVEFGWVVALLFVLGTWAYWIMSSVKVFLKDPSPRLREFRKKPRKTPNSSFEKFNWRLNPAPLANKF